jgi:hypothetical protein
MADMRIARLRSASKTDLLALKKVIRFTIVRSVTNIEMFRIYRSLTSDMDHNSGFCYHFALDR